MNAPLRRDACPTLATPMQTGDGLLARLNPVASGFSPKALIGLCKAAAMHGNGVIEVTGRGSLQIRGVTAASTAPLAAEVDALGIAVRGGVPVETGPLAGLDPAELRDPRPLAARIRDGIAQAGLDGRLGPKVSVVVDGGGGSWMDDVQADVRLTAERDGGGVSWRLALAGNATTARPVGRLGEIAACDAALTVLADIAALGRKGRARDLAPAVPAASGARSLGRADPSGVSIPLTDGRHALPVALPFGHAQAAALIDFVGQVEAIGIGEVRLSPGHSLILLGPSADAAGRAGAAARQAGLIVDADDARARVFACAGAPACASGHLAARTLAAEIAGRLPPGAAFDLHVSGCEKRCARPAHEGLTLLGLAESAALVLESRSREPVAVVAKSDAADAIGRVAALVAAERRSGESGRHCLERLGPERLAQAFR